MKRILSILLLLALLLPSTAFAKAKEYGIWFNHAKAITKITTDPVKLFEKYPSELARFCALIYQDCSEVDPTAKLIPSMNADPTAMILLSWHMDGMINMYFRIGEDKYKWLFFDLRDGGLNFDEWSSGQYTYSLSQVCRHGDSLYGLGDKKKRTKSLEELYYREFSYLDLILALSN